MCRTKSMRSLSRWFRSAASRFRSELGLVFSDMPGLRFISPGMTIGRNELVRLIRTGVDQDRYAKFVGQQHQLRVRAVIQLVAEIVSRQRLRDGFLCLRLSDGSDTQSFRLAFGTNPNRVSLAFGPGPGNLRVLGSDRQFKLFLLFLLFVSLFLFNGTQDN